MLLLTALIWGSAFVAQSTGMKYVGPFTFNMARSFIGFVVLIPVTLIFRKKRTAEHPLARAERRSLNSGSIIGGIFCGLALGVACSFQQLAVSMTSAGKVGFISSLYIILVPVLGLIIGKKIPKIIWLCVVLAVAGFYLLCINEGFSVALGDWFALISAFFFSVQMLIIDYFIAKDTDGVMMSCVQFFIAGVISLILAFIFETPSWEALWGAKITLLYAGVLSSGGGYTLQILGQKHTTPAVAAFLLSLESIFAILCSWIFLHETFTIRELLGCLLVFAAVILAQIPLPARKSKDI